MIAFQSIFAVGLTEAVAKGLGGRIKPPSLFESWSEKSKDT
jgi:hypothetical protein